MKRNHQAKGKTGIDPQKPTSLSHIVLQLSIIIMQQDKQESIQIFVLKRARRSTSTFRGNAWKKIH
jgi:hypothetical protein